MRARRNRWALRGLICLCLLSGPAFAGELGQGQWLAQFALEAKRQNVKPPIPWVTRLNLKSNHPSNILLADGTNIMARPTIVHSRYDASVQRDVSRFYQAGRPRLKVIAHYAGWHVGEIFSLGFDSGFSADKIEVKPALFVGYTRAYRFAERTHVTAGMGGWLGGGVSEQPCRDEFDREYYCPTLVAWSDYRPPRHRLSPYLVMTFSHVF